MTTGGHATVVAQQLPTNGVLPPRPRPVGISPRREKASSTGMEGLDGAPGPLSAVVPSMKT